MAKRASKTKAKAKAKSTASKKSPPKKKKAAKPAASAHAERFDRAPYALPVMDLGEAIALAGDLVKAKPARAGAVVDEDAKRIVTALARAKAQHASGGAGGDPADARPFDVAMDLAWATFVRRIHDHVELGASPPPGAKKIHAIVHDLSILKMNYLAEFAQIGARLDALKREGLVDDARSLAGDAFVDAVLRCHAAYGEALGVGREEEDAAAQTGLDRGEVRLALIDTMAEYAYQVLALARPGRAETWATVEKALAPILDAQSRAVLPAPPKPKPNAHPPLAQHP